MRFRTTFWLALVLLILVAYLFLVEFPLERKKQEAELESKKVFALDEADIQTMTIKYPGEEIRLARTDENLWEVTNPLVAQLDDREIKSLISTIVDMRLNRVIEEHNQDPAEYGFDHPPVEMTLTLNGKEEQVIVGDDGPMPNTLYVKQGSSQRVVLVEQWIKGSLTRTLFDLRRKSVLSIDRDKITELTLDFPEQNFLMIKEQSASGGHWMLKRPKVSPLDDDKISRLILTLSNLRATGFVDNEEQKEATRKEFGLADLTVTMKDNGKTRAVSFFRTEEKGATFAVTALDKPLYRISDTVLSDFKPDLFHYQDKHLLAFERDQVNRVEVKSSIESYTLQETDEAWFIEGETAALDDEEVDRFLLRLQRTMAQEQPDSPVELQAAGLDPPVTEIRLFDSKHRPLGHLTIGNETSGMLYSTGLPELGITLISKDILDDIPRKNEMMKAQE